MNIPHLFQKIKGLRLFHEISSSVLVYVVTNDIITGIGNDLGFRFIFSEQLKYQGVEGDIVFGMSGSGNSKNVLIDFQSH